MVDRMAYLLPLLLAIGFECITVVSCTVIRSHAEVLKESIKAEIEYKKAQSKKASDDS